MTLVNSTTGHNIHTLLTMLPPSNMTMHDIIMPVALNA